MDRIERFLSGRKIKGKRRIRCGEAVYTITRDDVKTVRCYRKNICMDRDVDFYRQLNLSFSRKRMEEGFPARKKNTRQKVLKKFPRKAGKPKASKRKIDDRNEITDIWEGETFEDLENYDQDILLTKAEESYSGSVELLKYTRDDLVKSLRGTYLRLYEPREKRQYKLRDLIKPLPKPETLFPFPEEVGLSFELGKNATIGISVDFRTFATVCGGRLDMYLFKNFLKFEFIMLHCNVDKIAFSKNGSICVLARDRIHVIDDCYEGESELGDFGVFCHQEFPAWRRSFVGSGSKLNEDRGCGELNVFHTVVKTKYRISDMEVHSNGKYVGTICGRTVVIYNLEDRTALKVLTVKEIPRKMKFHKSLPWIIVSTSNSLIVYDIIGRKTVCETKEQSLILDFLSVSDDIILLTNNLNRIILFDCSKGTILKTMLQKDVVTEIVQHCRYNLMCAICPTEMIMFYNNVSKNVVVPMKRIPGKYRHASFHPEHPWLYVMNGDRLVVFT